MRSGMQVLSEEICLHVHRVCAFGSTNKGNSRKADQQNIIYFKAIHNILLGAARGCMKEIEKNVDKKRLPAIKKLLEQMRKKVRMTKVGGVHAKGIFKEGEDCAMLPIKDAVSPDMMEIVNIVYPFAGKSFDFSDLRESDFYSVYMHRFYQQKQPWIMSHRDKAIDFF